MSINPLRLALPIAMTAVLGALAVSAAPSFTPVSSSQHVQTALGSTGSTHSSNGAAPSSKAPVAAATPAATAGAHGGSSPAATTSGQRKGYNGSPNAVTVYAFSGHANPTSVVAGLPAVVGGVSWIFGWKQIETAPGVYNWSSVDTAIAASAGSGRKTMLRIDGGASSPSWVPDQLTFSFQPMGPQPYQTVTMPKTWSTTYLSDFETFIRAYGARYSNDPRVTKSSRCPAAATRARWHCRNGRGGSAPVTPTR